MKSETRSYGGTRDRPGKSGGCGVNVSEKKTLFIRFRRRKVEKPIQVERLIMMKIFKKHSYYKALPYMSKD